MTGKTETILEVKNLQIHFHTDRGVIRAVEDVDFTVRKQEVWGLVGESASGKSVIGQALVGVVAKPAGRIVSGEVFFKGEDILKKNPKHPYTRGLLASLPKGEKGDVELYTIPGQLPNPLYHPIGCSFSPRCPHVVDRCQEVPLMEQVSQDHLVRCWRWKEI